MVQSILSPLVVVLLFFSGCSRPGTPASGQASVQAEPAAAPSEAPPAPASDEGGLQTATFAGGCFWCIDAPFEDLDGVKKVVSGYSGGSVRNPTYEQVSAGSTGHLETVQVTFDPSVVSYAEILDVYWREFDPTDGGGSFYDRGSQYVSAIFYHSEVQREVAEASKRRLGTSGVFAEPIVTAVRPFEAFYPAEDHHQHYCRTNADQYHAYRAGSGRDVYIEKTWGKPSWAGFQKPSADELKAKLTPIRFRVTQQDGTERAFQNEYDGNTRPGLYVDVVSGEPLFSSTDKFDSGTGWPSFTKPIDPRLVVKKPVPVLFGEGFEVRSRYADSHLGHVFDDGPLPNHLRYCMNSAALDFVPAEEMQKRGYGAFLWLFK